MILASLLCTARFILPGGIFFWTASLNSFLNFIVPWKNIRIIMEIVDYNIFFSNQRNCESEKSMMIGDMIQSEIKKCLGFVLYLWFLLSFARINIILPKILSHGHWKHQHFFLECFQSCFSNLFIMFSCSYKPFTWNLYKG